MSKGHAKRFLQPLGHLGVQNSATVARIRGDTRSRPAVATKRKNKYRHTPWATPSSPCKRPCNLRMGRFFRDAIDRAALILGNDGLSITEVKQCAFVGGDQGGNTIFQVIVSVAEMARENEGK
jgi:hypothetical protein